MAALSFICILLLFHCVASNYWREREAFITKEQSKMLGASIVLTPKEEIANNILMTRKLLEYDDTSKFNPARNFFEAREDMQASQVYIIIQNMPKGANLNGRDFFTISQEFFFNLTHRENLYCCEEKSEMYLKFLADANQDSFCKWTLLSDLRQKNTSIDKFLHEQFFLNAKTQKPSGILKRTSMFLSYKAVFQEQFYQSLLELYNDNIKYYEFRTALPDVYELDGTVYDSVAVASFYQETVDKFKADYPDFIGAGLIYSPSGRGNFTLETQILDKITTSHTNLILGFDIPIQPLLRTFNYINSAPQNLKRFFSTGNPKSHSTTDLNLVDAVLLNATRISQGLGLEQHPLVSKILKKRRTAIEVSPISSQVFKFVDDLVNHPAVSLLVRGHPIVIGNDKPSLWGATALSYDFYMVFMGMSPRNAGLAFLKQLALNSLEYSTLSLIEKQRAIELWTMDWDAFLDEIIPDQNLDKSYVDEL